MVGELPIFLWLLIKGVKDQQPSTTEPRNPILGQELAVEVRET